MSESERPRHPRVHASGAWSLSRKKQTPYGGAGPRTRAAAPAKGGYVGPPPLRRRARRGRGAGERGALLARAWDSRPLITVRRRVEQWLRRALVPWNCTLRRPPAPSCPRHVCLAALDDCSATRLSHRVPWRSARPRERSARFQWVRQRSPRDSASDRRRFTPGDSASSCPSPVGPSLASPHGTGSRWSRGPSEAAGSANPTFTGTCSSWGGLEG